MPVLNQKQQLMRKLMACSFALTEANLYLDSHPTCPMGLAYFKKHKEEFDKIQEEYVKKYGPVNFRQSEGNKKWEWVTEPFPWERGES